MARRPDIQGVEVVEGSQRNCLATSAVLRILDTHTLSLCKALAEAPPYLPGGSEIGAPNLLLLACTHEPNVVPLGCNLQQATVQPSCGLTEAFWGF
jgi:hypothetical protein